MIDEPTPRTLERDDLAPDPIDQFDRWFADAREGAGLRHPEALCLSTVDRDGWPEARIVLLKEVDHRGFVFYTNVESRKGLALERTPRAAVTFHWERLERQVRAVGTVEPVSDAEADAYFASRPRGSQVGAWASRQSRPLESRGSAGDRRGSDRGRVRGRPGATARALERLPRRSPPGRVLAGQARSPARPLPVPAQSGRGVALRASLPLTVRHHVPALLIQLVVGLAALAEDSRDPWIAPLEEGAAP